MSYDPKKVIQTALNEVGYLEKKSADKLDDKTANAGKNNYTKYARDLDALGFYNGKKNGFAWCDVFVDWCFVQTYGLEAAAKLTCQTPGKNNSGAGCTYSRNYYKANGRLFDKPQAGDQIFFYSSDKGRISHTGLVYDVDGSYVYTVEGNTSGANRVIANGGGVCKKKYKLTYARIAGYGRPEWGDDSSETPTEDNTDASKWAKTIVVSGKTVNVRKGNGTKYDRVATLKNGDKMEWIATAANGWHAGVYNEQVVWVSGRYAAVS